MAAPIYRQETFDIQTSTSVAIATTRQKLVEAMEEELAPLGLTAAQYFVIVLLATGRAESPADFSRALSYDSGAMTRLLDRVEAKGFIRRVPHGEDRRSVQIELTAKGRELYPKLMKIVVALNNRMLQGFSKTEVATLEKLLRRIQGNV